MKLLGSLYKIEKRTEEGGITVFTVSFDEGHFIYKAHFPGEPITPGACIFQMCTELLEEVLGGKIQIPGVKNVKFLQIIRPEETDTVDVSISATPLGDGNFKVQSTVSARETIYARISLSCRREN